MHVFTHTHTHQLRVHKQLLHGHVNSCVAPQVTIIGSTDEQTTSRAQVVESVCDRTVARTGASPDVLRNVLGPDYLAMLCLIGEMDVKAERSAVHNVHYSQ